MKRFLLPLLLLLQPLLALGLASLWFTPEGQSKVPDWQAPAPIAPELVDTVAVYNPTENPQDTVTLSERPLFSSHRRPPTPPKEAPPPPPPDPLDKTYINGLLNGEVAIAIASVEGRTRHLRPKDKVGNWELSAVGERSVTFSRGEDKRELPLTYTPLGAQRPTATSAAPPAEATDNAGVTSPQTSYNPAVAIEEAKREKLRRRNEMRANIGLPPLPSN